MCVLLVIGALGWAQKKSSRPDFKDYAVERVYQGAPAAPKITPDWRRFRTAIREGAKRKVQFAGHYTVPAWGCGAGAWHLSSSTRSAAGFMTDLGLQ